MDLSIVGQVESEDPRSLPLWLQHGQEGAMGAQAQCCQGCAMGREEHRVEVAPKWNNFLGGGHRKRQQTNKQKPKPNPAHKQQWQFSNGDFKREWRSVKATTDYGSDSLSPQLCLPPPACSSPGPSPSSAPTPCGFLFLSKPRGWGGDA